MRVRQIVLTASALVAAAALYPGAAEAQLVSESFSAVLLGGNECDSVAPPGGPNCRRGDPDAFGRATITVVTPGAICVTIQVDNLAGATAAHIHSGRETVNGPVVIALPPPVAPAGANPGASSFCGAIPAAALTAIDLNPSAFYINIHNAAFPGGAIRGQLF